MSSSTPTTIDERGGLPSASNMEKVVNCPGSYRLEQICPAEAAAEVTEEGTAVAKAMETGATGHLDAGGKELADDLKRIEDEIVNQWFEAMGFSDWDEVHREQRFWVRNPVSLVCIASAKPDVVFKANGHALVIDHKTGFYDPTDAPSNWQLRTQAVACWNEWPELSHVRVAWARARLGTRWDKCDYSTVELEHAERELHHAIWKSEQPDAARVPGKWCRYCRGKAYCEEASAWCFVAGMRPMLASATVNDRVSVLTPSQLAAIHDKARVIKAILEAVSARLKAMPESELAALGYKLRQSTITEIANWQKAESILVERNLLTLPEVRGLLKLPIGAVESFCLPKLAEQLGAESKAKRALRDVLKPACMEVLRGPQLMKVKE